MRHSIGLLALLALGSVSSIASAAPCTPIPSGTTICSPSGAISYTCITPSGSGYTFVNLWTSSTASGDVVSVEVSQGGSNYCENISLSGDLEIDFATGPNNDIISLFESITGDQLAATGSSYLKILIDSNGGDDHIMGSYDASTDLRQEFYGGDGIDIIEMKNAGGQAFGEDDDDNLWGGPNVDALHGGEGNDQINGAGNDDLLSGDSGDDSLFGEDGYDSLMGGSGNDILIGGADTDQMFGEDGNDDMHGEDGDDYMDGGEGDDTMYGDTDDDTMYGGDGDDYMNGGEGDDDMFGSAGVDTMDGGEGADEMFGGEDSDKLCGQGGDDVVHGDTVPNPYLTIMGYAYGQCDYANAGMNSMSETATGDVGSQDICTPDGPFSVHWSCEASAFPSDESCLDQGPSIEYLWSCNGQ